MSTMFLCHAIAHSDLMQITDSLSNNNEADFIGNWCSVNDVFDVTTTTTTTTTTTADAKTTANVTTTNMFTCIY